ncbi:MAG: hypothetical protein AB8G15_19965 [Saprospiraceae bacterium]
MNLRKLLISCGVLILFILILNVFFGLFRMPFVGVCAYEAVPATTACIVEWERGEALWTKLDSLPYIAQTKELHLAQQLRGDYAILEQLFEAAFTNQKILNEARVVAAMQMSGSSSINFTFLLDQYQSKFKLSDFLSKIEGNYRIQAFQLKKHTIYSIKNKDGVVASVANYRNLLIFAKHAYMVEDAMSQLGSIRTNLCRNKAFKATKALKVAANSIQLYLNFENFPSLYSSFLRTKKWEMAKMLSHLGSWYRLDLSFGADTIGIKGSGNPPAGNPFYQALDNKVPIVDEGLTKVLPDHLALLLRLGTDQLLPFANLTSTEDALNVSRYFSPWLTETVAYGMTEPYSNEVAATQFAIFKTKDTVLLRQHLDSLGAIQGLTEESVHQTYPIRRILMNDVLQPVFGAGIYLIQNPYFVVIEDYLILSNTKSALEIWIDKVIAGQTLNKNINFLKLQAAHPSGLHQLEVRLYPQYFPQMLKAWLKPSLRNAVDHDFDILSSIQQVNLGLDQEKGKLKMEGTALWATEQKTQTRVVWKTNTAAAIRMAPKVLKHPKTGKNEIFVQDVNNQIYLLNSGGDLLWKRSLEHPIISEIHQIDYYRNGQSQFLFNTKNKIYLLDREGKGVSSFPLRMQSEITNGVCVIESEDLRDYHFFVACKNQNIYGFNRSGNPLPGWNPKMGVGKVEFPLVHFQEAEKDYILAFNTRGKLYAFKRNGNTRFRSKSFKGDFLGGPQFQLLGASSRIVLGSTKGKAEVINLEGGSFSLQVAAARMENQQFIFTDVMEDVRKDYVVISGKEMSIYYYLDKEFKNKPFYTYETPPDVIFPISLTQNVKQYIGSLVREKKQINLVDPQGELYPGFPLAGTSQFTVTDLFDNNQNILIVANGNSIYSYRLPF